MKYQKKLVVIEARQFTSNNEKEGISNANIDAVVGWILNNGGKARHDRTNIFIQTLEGEMSASVGDFIIQGVKGEFYPCKPDIFSATYQEVTE